VLTLDSRANWNRQIHLFEYLNKKGVEKFFTSLKGIEAAFGHEGDGIVTCIDERIETQLGLSAAGSFALLSEKEARAYCIRANITGVTSHSDCGAVKEVMKTDPRYSLLSPSNPDQVNELAVILAEEQARKLGLQYCGHLKVNSINHYARCIYYVGTRTFRPVVGMPPGLVISRRHHISVNAIQELNFSLGIIRNTFPEYISPGEGAIRIIPIGGDSQEFSLDSLTGELESYFGGRDQTILIEGFSSSDVMKH
jgi:hypothetical protein